MITSADQFEYVTGADIDSEHPHGDLDRIEITGSPTNLIGYNGVRGESIAIFGEWAMERLKGPVACKHMVKGFWKDRTPTTIPDAPIFSRSISHTNFDALYKLYAKGYGLGSRWFTSETCNIDWSGTIAGPWVTRNMTDIFGQVMARYGVNTIDDTKIKHPFEAGEPISQNDVMGYYNQTLGHFPRGNGAGYVPSSTAITFSQADADSTSGGVMCYGDFTRTGTVPAEMSDEDFSIRSLGYSKCVWDNYDGGRYNGTIEGYVKDDYVSSMVELTVSSHVTNVVGIFINHVRSEGVLSSFVDEAYYVRLCPFVKRGASTFTSAGVGTPPDIIETTGVECQVEEYGAGLSYGHTNITQSVIPILFFDKHCDY